MTTMTTTTAAHQTYIMIDTFGLMSIAGIIGIGIIVLLAAAIVQTIREINDKI